MKLPFLLLFIIATATGMLAQTDTAKGSLVINVDKKVEDFIEQRKQDNLNDSLIKGYRIQISITDKRNDAKEAKERFSNMYPNCAVYLIFDSPHFKVRVGDFKTKLEAQALLFKLIEEFPTLFLVEDKINPPPLEPCY